MIIVIIDGVTGLRVLINFVRNVQLWEIAITLDGSSSIYKDIDGSVVFVKLLPPPVGICRAPVFAVLSPFPPLCKGHWLCLSGSFVSPLCFSICKGLSQG